MKKLLVFLFAVILFSQSFSMSFGQWSDYNEHDDPIITELPDGTVVKKYPDGKIITEYYDGIIIIEHPDGTKTQEYFSYSETKSDGTVVTRDNDGLLTSVYPDGKIIREYPDDPVVSSWSAFGRSLIPGETVTEYPDGKITFEYPDGKIITDYPRDQKFTDSIDGHILTSGVTVIEFPDKTKTIDYPNGKKIIIHPDGTKTITNSDGDMITTSVSNSPKSSDPVIPSWFKSNAKWWKEGLISDGDIINALESLIIQDVIPLDRFVKSSSGLEHAASVSSGGTFGNSYDRPKIPSYQKDVFGFWSDGQISDSEIVNSVGHLMNLGIINSEKIHAEISERQEKFEKAFTARDLDDASSREYGIDSRTSTAMCENDDVCDSDKGEVCSTRPGESEGKCIPTWFGIQHATAESIYYAQMWNWAIFTQYLGLKNAESDILIEMSDKKWSEYSIDKNPELMKDATLLETESRRVMGEKKQILDSLNAAKEFSEQAKEIALKKGSHVLDLEKNVLEQQEIIDSTSSKLETFGDFKDKVRELKRFQDMNDDAIKDLIEGSRNYWKADENFRENDGVVPLLMMSGPFGDYGNAVENGAVMWKVLSDGEGNFLSPEWLEAYDLGLNPDDPEIYLGGITDSETGRVDLLAGKYIGDEDSAAGELASFISLGDPDIVKGHILIKNDYHSVKYNVLTHLLEWNTVLHEDDVQPNDSLDDKIGYDEVQSPVEDDVEVVGQYDSYDNIADSSAYDEPSEEEPGKEPVEEESGTSNEGPTLDELESGVANVGGLVGIVSGYSSEVSVGNTINLGTSWGGSLIDSDSSANVGKYVGVANIEGSVGSINIQVTGCDLYVINGKYSDDSDEFKIECTSGVKVGHDPNSLFQLRWIDNSGLLLGNDDISSITNLDTSTWEHVEMVIYGPNYLVISGSINSVSQ